MVADDDVIDPDTGEIYVNAGEGFTRDAVDRIATSMLKEVSALAPQKDPIILESFKDDGTDSHEAALLKIYQKLRPGMTLAIEPMVNAGRPGVKILKDGWTVVTQDGSLSAHFEHTVLITEGEPEILTWPEKVPSKLKV